MWGGGVKVKKVNIREAAAYGNLALDYQITSNLCGGNVEAERFQPS